MEVRTPRPSPIGDGDYKTYTDAAYGNPYGTIHLADGYALDLADVHVEDCDRLIRAVSTVREQLLRFQAQAAAPHGRKHLWHGTCQLCGRPEDDELHAEAASAEAMDALVAAWPPVPAITITDDEPEDHPDTAGPAYGEAELRRADAYRDHPGEDDSLAARAALAASVTAGVPLTVYDDEPRCECGHQRALHVKEPVSKGPVSACNAVACGCTRFSDAASVTE